MTMTINPETHTPETHNPRNGNLETQTTAAQNRPINTVPTSRSTADSIKALPTTLNAEWIKLASLRSNKAIIGLTAIVSGFVTWAIATYVTDAPMTITEIFSVGTVFTAVFAAVGGVLLFTSESQHGTLGPALMAQPARVVIAAAKTIITAGYGALLGAVGLAAGFAGAWLGPIATGDTSNLVSTSLWAIGFASLAAVLGLGIGMIARVSTAAVSGILVWWLVVENLVGLFLAERFARFMPFTAGNGMLGGQGPDQPVTDLTLSATENALVFGGYAALALVIGTVLLYRRDTN